MKILSRHILRQVAAPCMLALAVISFIAVSGELHAKLGDLPANVLGQVGLWDLIRVTAFLLPTLVSLVIPATFLIGILLAFGRLSQQGEIIAMKAAGISMKQIVLPVIGAGALLSVGCFLLQDLVQPWALTRLNQLFYVEMPLRPTLDVLPVGTMHDYGSWRVYVGSKDPETGELHDVDIFIPDEGGSTKVFHAESAQLVREGDSVALVADVHMFLLEENNLVQAHWAGMKLKLPALTGRAAPSMRRTLSIGSLYRRQLDMEREYRGSGSAAALDELRKTRTEISDRLAFSIGCFAVAFLAAPLGVRARRSGRSYTFAMGFGIILVYYTLWTLTEPGSEALLRPITHVVAMGQIANATLVVAGVWFLWRVDRI